MRDHYTETQLAAWKATLDQKMEMAMRLPPTVDPTPIIGKIMDELTQYEKALYQSGALKKSPNLSLKPPTSSKVVTIVAQGAINQNAKYLNDPHLAHQAMEGLREGLIVELAQQLADVAKWSIAEDYQTMTTRISIKVNVVVEEED
jgi:hypothetical protein